jgi:hypothetical protein
VLTIPAAFIIGGVMLYSITPETAWWMPPCLFHKLTGLYCPGCGTARGLHKLLHGDILGALRLNALTVAAVPLLAYLLANVVWCGLAGAKSRPRSLPSWAAWVIAGSIGAFWVARNIPVYPFTLLAPH